MQRKEMAMSDQNLFRFILHKDQKMIIYNHLIKLFSIKYQNFP